MHLKRSTTILLVVLIAGQSCAVAAKQADLPPWLAIYIAKLPAGDQTVVEESQYNGKRVFHIMSSDRGPDTGDEHILRAEDGRVICEFGGLAGHVTSGTCDIAKIRFIRTLLPKAAAQR